MKLLDKKGWFARIYAEIKIKKDFDETVLSEGFPFDIGAVTLTSKDGKRNFLLDTYYTEYCNDKEKKGETYTFYCRLEVDFDTFPIGNDIKLGEFNYELTVEDLDEATAVFYCGYDEEFFEPVIHCVFGEGNWEQTHAILCELE